MKIEQLFDQKLADFLDAYSDTKESLGSGILKSIKNSKRSELIIPVLGMQGMGKSTLINGLLEENILPNDADETTCVPVEVKFGTTECAKVHFFDKKNEIIVHTREELNEYVDNNYNPANEKHVANIELFRNISILKDGMVIVDLPGVGSLTKENENTTKRYVENLCSAIFVIPTVPTIRNKEALFIKSLWSQFSKAIFVQNEWGESKEELNDSIDFNNKVLRKIAEEVHNPYNDEIIVVNAYKAVAGAVKNDQSLIDKSNIKTLYDKIIEIASNWEDTRESLLQTRINLSIEYVKGVILKRLSDLKKSKDEIEEENKRQLEVFHQGTIELLDKVDKLKRYLRDQEDEVYFTTRQKASESAKKIRAAIYRVIDKGVYDGERLSTAFNDIQEDEIKDFTNDIIDLFMTIKFEVEKQFAEIQQIQIDNDINIHAEKTDFGNSFKWEKGFQVISNIGGAIGMLGAKSLLVACGFAGPAGWVVAGVGFAILSVFSLLGFGVKKIKQSERADKAKKQISPYIDEIEHSLMKSIPSKYEEFAFSCYEILDKIVSDRREEEARFKKSLNEVIDDSQEEKLQKDWEYIINEQKKFQYV
ncbi:MAG: dynamin family protein [Prevotella sp.]|nr:dynamin family protein [Prevotella sp.]